MELGTFEMLRVLSQVYNELFPTRQGPARCDTKIFKDLRCLNNDTVKLESCVRVEC